MGRNMTPEGMKAKKTSFKISEVRAAITRHDALLAEIFSENYDRAIDRRPPNLACDYEYDHHGWD